jgi:hypothetical protein
MPFNYTVQAQVVDLCFDKPRVEDRFYVDTNAWLGRLPERPVCPATKRASVSWCCGCRFKVRR